MVKSGRLLQIIFGLLFLLVAPQPVQAASPPANKHVLIMNSYHRGFVWSDEEEKGFIERLQEVYPTADIAIEFLDSKHYPDRKSLRQVKDFLLTKYRGTRFDLVVAFDNPALDMLARYRGELFPEIPVVFSGVSDFEPSLLRGRKRVTGVVEIQDVKNTLDMALMFHPGTKHVLMISDTTTSGESLRREVEALIPLFAERVKIRFLPPCTFDEVRTEIGSLPSNAVALITSYSTDRKGNTVSLAESTRIFTSAAKVPVYGVHDTRLGHGIVGGSLLSGRNHGRRAADLALRILGGEEPDAIPVDTTGTARPMFDLVQLKRFGVVQQYLPIDSIIMHEPKSIFREHREVVLGTVAVFTVLGIMLTFFTAAVVRRKGVEESLRQANLVVENSPAVLFRRKAAVGWPVELVSGNITQFGYTPEELLSGLVTFASMVHPEDRNRVASEVEFYTASGSIQFQQEYRVITRDGQIRWIEDRTTVQRDMKGSPTYYQGIVLDITNRRKAEEALHEKTEELDRIFNLSLDLLCIAGIDGRFIRVNPAWEQTLGFRSDELEGRRFIDFVHPEDISATLQATESAASKDIIDFTNRYRCRDGAYRWIEWRSKPYRGTFIYAAARDITERKRTEELLRASETFLDSIIEHSPYSTWVADKTGTLIRSNQMLRDVLQVTDLDIVGRYNVFQDKMVREQGLLPLVKRVFEQGETARFTMQYNSSELRQREDKRSRQLILHITMSPVLDIHKKVVNVIVQHVDITEQKRVVEALRESEARFRTVVESAPLPIVITTESEETEYVNPRFTEMFGYRLEDIPSMDDWYRLAYPDPTYRQYLRERLQWALKRIAEGGAPIRGFEIEITCKDGSIKNAELFGGALGPKMLRIFNDITYRKSAEMALLESEQRFRILAEASFEGIALSEKGILQDVNDQFASMLGRDRNELIGQPVITFIAPQHRDLTAEAIRRGRLDPYESLLLRKDGTTFPVESRARTTQVGDRQVRVTAIRDITERKKAESEQAKLKEQLFQSQKMETVGLLAGGIAHDFNNLLTPILGYSEILMRGLPEEDPNRLKLEYIQQAADLAKGLTRRLLAFGRKQMLELQVIHLGDVIHEFEHVLHRTIRENIQIRIHTAPSLGMVRADKGQIGQVLLNLSINAQDAMPEGGVLTIESRDIDLDESYTSTHLEVAPGPYVMLSVSDTGMGMDEQTLEHVFEPFFTTKELGRGTGLGLATVYGIVKQHNGSLSVYSEQNHGSIFKIFLPRTGEERKQSGERLIQPDRIKRGNETVLVVEDDEKVRTLVCRMLEDLGYLVLAAESVDHCLEMTKSHPGIIHLLLADVIMPKKNGKELYVLLKRGRPGLKVLFMSGYPRNVIGRHGVLDIGINFLQKPFTLAALAQKTRKILDS
jgi:two-component system cell cycle sensor histidine kinase/response regulator CckA